MSKLIIALLLNCVVIDSIGATLSGRGYIDMPLATSIAALLSLGNDKFLVVQGADYDRDFVVPLLWGSSITMSLKVVKEFRYIYTSLPLPEEGAQLIEVEELGKSSIRSIIKVNSDHEIVQTFPRPIGLDLHTSIIRGRELISYGYDQEAYFNVFDLTTLDRLKSIRPSSGSEFRIVDLLKWNKKGVVVQTISKTGGELVFYNNEFKEISRISIPHEDNDEYIYTYPAFARVLPDNRVLLMLENPSETSFSALLYVDPTTSKIVRLPIKYPLSGSYCSPFLRKEGQTLLLEDSIFISCLDIGIYKLDLLGNFIWQFHDKDVKNFYVASLLQTSKDFVFFANVDLDQFYLLDSKTGSVSSSAKLDFLKDSPNKIWKEMGSRPLEMPDGTIVAVVGMQGSYSGIKERPKVVFLDFK